MAKNKSRVFKGSFSKGMTFMAILLLTTSCVQVKEPHTLLLEKTCSHNYNRYFVSFDRNYAIPVKEYPKNEPLTADIFVELYDRKIYAILSAHYKVPHIGKDTRVAELNSPPFNKINDVPEKPDWIPFVHSDNIINGQNFVVRSSSGKIYLVNIKVYRKFYMRLKYKELPSNGYEGMLEKKLIKPLREIAPLNKWEKTRTGKIRALK